MQPVNTECKGIRKMLYMYTVYGKLSEVELVYNINIPPDFQRETKIENTSNMHLSIYI